MQAISKERIQAAWKKNMRRIALVVVSLVLCAMIISSIDWSSSKEENGSETKENGWTHFEGDCAPRILADTSASWSLDDAKKACLENPDCVAVVEDQVKGKYNQRGTYCAQEKKPRWWQQTEMCTEDKKPIPGKGCAQKNTFWLAR